MQSQLGPINNENDLEMYKRFIDQDKSITIGRREKQAEQKPERNECKYVPETLCNSAFLPAYLTKNIGKPVKIEFQIGDNLETRVGRLISVGASFIELKLIKQCTTMICDLHSIKFVTVIHDNDLRKLNMR
ncbi:MAG: hypothetical protein IJ470_02365 [Clostridia bacterium]|nr:hypothetical protein [Clostridia bacterium]